MAVAPTTLAVEQLKLYVDYASDPKLTDNELIAVLSMYAIADANDTAPTGIWGTFDLYGAAAEAWRIKAGRASTYISVSADGQQMSLNQIRDACNQQYEYYTRLRQTGTITVSDEE